MATAKDKPAATIVKIATAKIEGFTPPAKPVRTNANAAKYPFDALEVGDYFSVSGKTRRQMQPTIGRANAKYRTEAKDAAGNVVSSSQDREFYAVDVDAETAKALKGTEHEGASVLIVRNA